MNNISNEISNNMFENVTRFPNIIAKHIGKHPNRYRKLAPLASMIDRAVRLSEEDK